MPANKANQKNDIKFNDLYKWNRVLAVLHFLQGLAVLLLGVSKALPVNTSFLGVDTLATKVADRTVLAPAVHQLFEVNLVYLVATFFFLSALAHLSMATWYRSEYERNLSEGVNRLRWIEYSLSASVMLVAIGLLSGIYDFSSLLMIFTLTAVMSLLGLVMETHNPLKKRAKPNWLSMIVGSIAGFVPWVVFATYLVGSNVFGGGVPTFVYWIYGTMFVLFASFATNMYLQYAKKGRWSQYLYGERAYMVLSLVAKTALAWQIFAGALRP